MTDKLNEMIRQYVAKPEGRIWSVALEWADKVTDLEQQAEKWELEAKRLYGVGQDIEEMRAALEQRVEGLEALVEPATHFAAAGYAEPQTDWRQALLEALAALPEHLR